jgi:hypothetical protein
VVYRHFIINFLIVVLVCLSSPVRYVLLKYFGCVGLHLCIFEDISVNIVYSCYTLPNVL